MSKKAHYIQRDINRDKKIKETYDVFFDCMLRHLKTDRTILNIRERERIADRVRRETAEKLIAQRKMRRTAKKRNNWVNFKKR